MPKATVVISLLIFILFNSFTILQKRTNQKDDYILLNKVLKDLCLVKKNTTISLKSSNNNEFVIETIKKIKEYEERGDYNKLDSLKQSLWIKENELNNVLNKKEYNVLISQKANSFWDFKKTQNSNVVEFDKNKTNINHLVVSISKPIYSSDSKFAFVLVNKPSSSSIHIYKKHNNQWFFHKLISPMLH